MIAFIDANNLGYRAYHTTGHLQYGADLTGVAYGFLNQVFTFFKNAPSGIEPIFCWDSKHNLRKEIFPGYKKRDDQTDGDIAKRDELYSQFNIIREEILPALGWQGRCLIRDGYEADDLIAWGCVESDDNCIIVSGDEDLYQCLYYDGGIEVSIFNPGKNEFYRAWDLQKNYNNISPEQWPAVKAIAGCTSDKIPGAYGVGEKTAIKYLQGGLKYGSKKYMEIEILKAHGGYDRNLKLVKLPFGDWDDQKFNLSKVILIKSDWHDTFKKYGMDSFICRLGELSNIFNLK